MDERRSYALQSTAAAVRAFRKNLLEVKLTKEIILLKEVAEADINDSSILKGIRMSCGGSDPIFADVAIVCNVYCFTLYIR